MTTLLIVDDHAGFRRHAAAALAAEGLSVIGEADDGASALHAVATLHPDVVLLDVGLPGGDGISWCGAIAGAGTMVVLTSSRDASDYGTRLHDVSGSCGFLAKSELSAAAILDLLGERGP